MPCHVLIGNFNNHNSHDANPPDCQHILATSPSGHPIAQGKGENVKCCAGEQGNVRLVPLLNLFYKEHKAHNCSYSHPSPPEPMRIPKDAVCLRKLSKTHDTNTHVE